MTASPAIVGGAVITAYRVKPFSLRPYITRAVDDSGHASDFADFSCEASALHHDQLCRKLPRT